MIVNTKVLKGIIFKISMFKIGSQIIKHKVNGSQVGVFLHPLKMHAIPKHFSLCRPLLSEGSTGRTCTLKAM